MGKLDSLKICRECGAHCCKYGGTTAIKTEVNKIVQAGFENKFKKIDNNIYITPWGKNGICPYLKNKVCSIHQVRPILCKCFPIFKSANNNLYMQQCPLSNYLTKKDIERSKILLKTVSIELIDASNEYNKNFEKEFLKRFYRYKIKKIS